MRYCYALLILFTLAFSVHAQERVFSEYQYDDVGNTISITQDQSSEALRVDSFTPSFLRQNQVVNVTVNGVGLGGARVDNVDGIFSFSNIQSTNEQLTFTISVPADAPEGPSQISLSTAFGTVFLNPNVVTQLPDFRVSPIPIVLAGQASKRLLVSLSRTDPFDHEFDISIIDTSIATLNVSNFNIASGQIKPDQNIDISPVSQGTTTILFASETLGNFSYTVRVIGEDETFEANAVNGEVGNFVSKSVGINKLVVTPSPSIVPFGPIVGELRIIKETSVVPAAPTSQSIVGSSAVGVLKGSSINAVAPDAIAQNSVNNILTISGSGLSNVDSVSIIPDDNLTIGEPSISNDGQSLTLSVDVANDTEFSQRQVVLQAGETTIPAINPTSDRFWVGGSTPVINSITPIFLNRNDFRTITVSGSNLQAVTGVSFVNDEGLSFTGPLTIADDGLSLTFKIRISQFALIGPRQLVLETSLGNSQELNPDAATLIVQDGPPRTVSPIITPLVGINKLSNNQETNEATLTSVPVGITRGAILTSVLPRSGVQGSSLRLDLEGVNLSSVVSAEFEPATGITVGEFIAAADGLSATLDIEISNDAERAVRQLRLSNGSNILSTVATQDRFEVITMRPEINSVSPQQIALGDSNVPLVIRGELFNDASSVSVIPDDGVTVSGPLTVSLDGTVLETQLIVSENAALGPRIVQVTTAGGTTESVISVNNTIQVVQSISSIVSPVVSSQLGVVKQNRNDGVPGGSLSERLFLSNEIGLVKQATPVQVEQTTTNFAPLLGITKGSVVQTINPTRLPIDISGQSIQVNGIGLDNVVTVRTVPADGITLNGPAIISDDGTTVTFTADVAEDAPQTSRRLELVTSDDLIIPFTLPQNSLLQVIGLTPQIDSIEPIQEARGATFVMTVQGINFADVQAIQAIPENGIQFGAPTVASDGRSLTVQVAIDNDAVSQEKVIQVITAAGSTISISMPENTFTVISE